MNTDLRRLVEDRAAYESITPQEAARRYFVELTAPDPVDRCVRCEERKPGANEYAGGIEPDGSEWRTVRFVCNSCRPSLSPGEFIRLM